MLKQVAFKINFNQYRLPGDPLPLPRDILYPQNMALTPPTSGGGSVGTSAD
jgi:hypothetical protein